MPTPSMPSPESDPAGSPVENTSTEPSKSTSVEESQEATASLKAPASSTGTAVSAGITTDAEGGVDTAVESVSSSARETQSAPVAPPAAVEIFGDRLPLAIQYAESLATDGIIRGLIGPRETPRLWDRHIMNCAVIGEAIPENATVVDVGSGGGLPGIPLAIARPDLHITLVEPMLRRTTYLEEIVEKLQLTNVRVVRGKAQNPDVVRAAAGAQVVTSRAVASLGALAEMSMPLLAMGGYMMAMKGDIVQEEIDRDAETIAECGGAPAIARSVGGDLLEHPTYLAITQRIAPARRKPNKNKKRSQQGTSPSATRNNHSSESRREGRNGSPHADVRSSNRGQWRETTDRHGYRSSRRDGYSDRRSNRDSHDGYRADRDSYGGHRHDQRAYSDDMHTPGGVADHRSGRDRYHQGTGSRSASSRHSASNNRRTEGRPSAHSRPNPFRRDGGTRRDDHRR